jgi:putative addiction module antidote
MAALKITQIGSSLGIILPKEILTRLRIGKGDRLYATETGDGIALSPYDPDLAAQIDDAEAIMRQDRSLLRRLAK